MKFFISILSACLLLFSCTSEDKNTDSGKANLPVFPQHIVQKTKNINYLDTLKFKKTGSTIFPVSKKQFEKAKPSEHKTLVENFCKQSKGYQNGIWEGQNDCSWAIEKYKLEKLKNRVERKGDTLVLKLENGEKAEFIHDKSNPDKILFFQFKNYLQNAGFFVIEAIQKNKCRISTLINANDGNSFQINGTLYFSEDQSTFLSTTFNNEFPFHCTNKIGFYQISNTKIEKVWHISTGDWGVTDARFIDQKAFLLEQSTTGIPSEFKRYAKVIATK